MGSLLATVFTGIFQIPPALQEMAPSLLGIAVLEGAVTLYACFYRGVLLSHSLHQWTNIGNTLFHIIVGLGTLVLLLAAVAVLLVGWAPRASGAAWALVAISFVIGYLGGLLELPDWVLDLSPFTHVASVPAESMTTAPVVVLLGLTAVVLAAGWLGFSRRDINA